MSFSGTSAPAPPPARDRREPLGRLRHRRRRRVGVDLEAGRLERPVEVRRDLVVLAGLDDQRDVGVGPAAGEALRLAEDGEPREEDEQDRQQHGQRIAARDALGDRAARTRSPCGRAAHRERRR